MQKLIPLITLLSSSLAFGRGLDYNAVCTLLSNQPEVGKTGTMIVGIGLQKNDYYFAGLAQVKQVNGQPILEEANKVILSQQSIRKLIQGGVRYFNAEINLTVKSNGKTGALKVDSAGTGDGLKIKLEDTIRDTLPIEKCLSESQLTLCIVAGAGC